MQVNHTSINTVLMNATIGVTWGALSFLLDGFRRHAAALDRRLAQAAPEERRLFEAKIRAITTDLPPLPDFSGFHAAFRTSDVGDGDLRAAFFLAFADGAIEHVPLSAAERGDPRRAAAGLDALRGPLPARLPHPGAGPAGERADHRVHAQARRERGARLPARAGPGGVLARAAGTPRRAASANAWSRPSDWARAFAAADLH